MINYIKKKLEKRRLKRTFREYGHEVKKFNIEGLGTVEYAQWLHPFDTPKKITQNNIEFYNELISPGAMIIDIGAHTGDTTVPMALATGKEGLVLGLEPNPYVFKILSANAKLNPERTHIVPLCFAATAKDGEFTFNYSDASFCNGGYLEKIRKRRHGHKYTLNVIGKNLEDYLQDQYAERLSDLQLIKVDAEGYDKEILKTIPTILAKYRPVLMVECYKRLSMEERQELWDVLDGFGYKVYHLENFNADGDRTLLGREDMMIERHFEMLALPKDHK